MLGNFNFIDLIKPLRGTSTIFSKYPKLKNEIDKWMAWDKNEVTKNEIAEMVQNNKVDQLKDRMLSRVIFGTGGIRALLGAGFSRMNELVVIQIAQGICDYLLFISATPEGRGVVIGYDVRRNSGSFAELAASIFIQKRFSVFLFSKPVTNAFVSYAVTRYNAEMGIMFTGGHNAKIYSGCKLYWRNGAPIDHFHSKAVIKHMHMNMCPWMDSWNLGYLENRLYCVDPFDDIMLRYQIDCFNYCFNYNANTASKEKITFTPLHGASLPIFQAVFKEFGFEEEHLLVVADEAKPNPDFPNIDPPDPVESIRVLKNAVKTADTNNSKLILCASQDAGRFELAEKLSDQSWYYFTGNEIGILLTWWLWTNWRSSNPQISAENVYVVTSAVSTLFSKTIAGKEGFKFAETLPGFHWLSNRACDLKNAKKHVFLTWEESMGYMPGVSNEKDAVLTCAIFADFFTHLNRQNMTFHGQLEKIFSTYGLHLSRSSYAIYSSTETVEKIFKDLQKHETAIGEHKVKSVRDLYSHFDSSTTNHKPALSYPSKCHMITYLLENGAAITVRTSTTEPKIRYYVDVVATPNQPILRDKATAKAMLVSLESSVKNGLLQSSKYKLKLENESVNK